MTNTAPVRLRIIGDVVRSARRCGHRSWMNERDLVLAPASRQSLVGYGTSVVRIDLPREAVEKPPIGEYISFREYG